MRDCCLYTLFSLGQACLESEENLTRPCIYIKRSSRICQPFNHLVLDVSTFFSVLKNLEADFLEKSFSFTFLPFGSFPYIFPYVMGCFGSLNVFGSESSIFLARIFLTLEVCSMFSGMFFNIFI